MANDGPAMHVPSVIEKKRDGKTLSEREIHALIAGYTTGEIPDYQVSAFAMAVYFQGMTAEETAALTRAMLESGEVFSYPDGAPRIVDKHSTGGIGDKVSLVLAPLLACDDVWVPMISGRGLGITGGTLDKLESVPGFRVGLTKEETLAQLQKIGVAMVGQTGNVCPADRKLYALRDVTATVPSQPLIVASIMSKKLAESLDVLVLDVKFGSGAFMKTRREAESLAQAMVEVGEAMGVSTKACLNPMEEPLGRAVGNALEMKEALDALAGGGPDDLRSLVLDLAAEVSIADRGQLEKWLDDGTAKEKIVTMVEEQGGDSSCLDDFDAVHPAAVIREIVAGQGGIVSGVDADTVGRASLSLGAGRARSDDTIDFSVGFDRLVKTGDSIAEGDVLARVHAASEESAKEAAQSLISAVSFS